MACPPRERLRKAPSYRPPPDREDFSTPWLKHRKRCHWSVLAALRVDRPIDGDGRRVRSELGVRLRCGRAGPGNLGRAVADTRIVGFGTGPDLCARGRLYG